MASPKLYDCEIRAEKNKELKFTLNMVNKQESTLHPIDPVFKLSARDYE